MRCVVSTVTEDSNAELHEELGRAEAELLQDYDDEENANGEDQDDYEGAISALENY